MNFYLSEQKGQNKESLQQMVADDSSNNMADSIDNHIYFYGRIDQEKSLKLTKILKEKSDIMKWIQIKYSLQESPLLYLHINSYGGELNASLAIFDAIRDLSVPVYTIAEGIAASGGSIILLSGKKRFIRKHAYVLIHQLRGSMWGTYERMKDDIKNSEKMMELLWDLYSENTKVKRAEIEKILKRDLYWSSEECLKKGIVDEIWSTQHNSPK